MASNIDGVSPTRRRPPPLPPVEPTENQSSHSSVTARPVPQTPTSQLFSLQVDVLQKRSGAEVEVACKKLIASENHLATDVARTENAIERFQKVTKGMAASSAVAAPVEQSVDLVSAHVFSPLDFLSDENVHIVEEFLDEIKMLDQTLLTIELALQGTRFLGEGASLVLRNRYLKDAKRYRVLLKKVMKNLNGDPQTKMKLYIKLGNYISNLDAKIQTQQLAYDTELTEYKIKNVAYLPRGVNIILKLTKNMTHTIGAFVGGAANLASIFMAYRERRHADKAVALHDSWLQEAERTVENRIDIDPATRQEALKTRKGLIGQLKALTLDKHRVVNSFLKTTQKYKRIQLGATTVLALAAVALQAAALFVSVGIFIVFPYAGLIIGGLLFMGIGTYYWATKRPNLFVAMVKTCIPSMLYNIVNSIRSWQLQRKQVQLLSHATSYVDQIGRSRLGNVAEMSEKFIKEHNDMRQEIQRLQSKVRYWEAKKNDIQERLLNAELADQNAKLVGGPLTLAGLVDAIATQFTALSSVDRRDISHSTGLDFAGLDALPENERRKALRDRVLGSYLGIGEDDFLASLKAKKKAEEAKLKHAI